MPTVVITPDAISVKLCSKHLEVSKKSDDKNGDATKINIPLFDIDRIIIYGSPSITFPVLHRLMKLNTPVIFLSAKGRWLGEFDTGGFINSSRRIQQYKMVSNTRLRNKISSKIILAKIRNSRRVLQRLSAARKQSDAKPQRATSDFLQEICVNLRCSDDMPLNMIRGSEGIAAAGYFKRLADFFPAETPFEERSRQPPLNAANALLSWTYAIVLGEIETAVRIHGFDPAIGFLHEMGPSMPSLALDLLEPLRAPLCDMLTLHLLNHRIIQAKHFRHSDSDNGVYLTDEGKRLFFPAYEQTMSRKFMVAPDAPRTDFRQVIEKQVCSVSKILNGETPSGFFLAP